LLSYDKKPVASGLRVLLNMQEMDIALQQTGLNTTQKFVARNTDIVRPVVKSMIDGIRFMGSGSDFGNDSAEKPYECFD